MSLIIKQLAKYFSILAALSTANVHAAEYFDPEMLIISQGDTVLYNNEDLSLFNEIDSLPGDYQLDLYVNNNKIEHRSIYLYAAQNTQGHQQLTPCFQPHELEHYGLDLPSPVSTIRVENSRVCVDLAQLNYAKSTLNLNQSQLLIQVPQAYVIPERLNFFERQYWDNGIPAFRVDYNVSQFSERQNSKTDNNTFANFRSSANWGAWRFNQNATWSHNNGKDQWKTLSNSLSRNIPVINSEIVFGDNYSSSSLFEGIKIRGAILQSDRSMQPRHTNTYAPGISGIADSESIVTIIQNNNVIYKKSITAGPFYLTDYYPTSNGGNLTVEITGTDGQVKRQIVPFSSLAFLERKDSYSYHVAMGQYKREGGDHEFVNQAEVIYGLTDFVTVAAGSQLSKHYQAFSLGSGLNLGQFGAASANMIHAISDFDSNIIKGISKSNRANGNAFKLNYSKTFTPTNTSLTVAGYKHFSTGYYSFNDVMDYNAQLSASNGGDLFLDQSNKLRHQFDFTLNQTLPKYWGSLNMNMSLYNYQNKKDLQTYNLGYSLSKNNVNYGLYYNYYDNVSQDDARGKYSASFNVSMPLFADKKRSPTYLSYNIGHSDDGKNNQIVQINGQAGSRSQASWNIYQGYDDKNYGGVSGSYKAPFATLNAGYSYNGRDQQRLNTNIAGSFLATQYGALFSQPLQATNALILTKDVKGLQINNSYATRTNKVGLAVLPGLSPYRRNQIALDTQSIPEDAEIEETIMSRIIPTRGALVLADFKAKHGYKILMTLENEQLGDIPMGAKVRLAGGQTALVASFNQTYVLTDQPKGQVHVDWVSSNQTTSCIAQFDLADMQPVNGLYLVKSNCLAQPSNTSLE